MRKVHISLVGKQKEPVLNGIEHSKPDLVYLIHSADTLEYAKTIKSEISVQSILKEFDPTDLDSIYDGIDYLKMELSPDDQVSLNLVSGTKHWSLAFFDCFRDEINADIFLIDQNRIVSSFISREVSELAFDMDKVFRLNGNPLSSSNYTLLADYTQEDYSVLDEVMNHVRYLEPFFKLATVRPENMDITAPSAIYRMDRASIAWDGQNFVETVLFNKRSGQWETSSLESPHAKKIVFDSGWFELYVASMISRWPCAKDIRLNCKFPPRVINGYETLKNEVDVVCNAGNKILFVECKTHLKKPTDIDKFRTAVSNYGGDASKALFVTDKPMTLMQKEKCEESGIMYFSIQENMHDTVQQLIALLDSEKNKINA